MKLLESLNTLQYDQRISFYKNITILDIGYGNSITWARIYSELKFKKILGIDIAKNDSIFSKIDELSLSTEKATNLFLFETIDLESFINNSKHSKKNYDLIIMSQFLYLFTKEKAREYILKTIPLIKTNGFLYIYLGSENFQYPQNRPKDAPD